MCFAPDADPSCLKSLLAVQRLKHDFEDTSRCPSPWTCTPGRRMPLSSPRHWRQMCSGWASSGRRAPIRTTCSGS